MSIDRTVVKPKIKTASSIPLFNPITRTSSWSDVQIQILGKEGPSIIKFGETESPKIFRATYEKLLGKGSYGDVYLVRVDSSETHSDFLKHLDRVCTHSKLDSQGNEIFQLALKISHYGPKQCQNDAHSESCRQQAAKEIEMNVALDGVKGVPQAVIAWEEPWAQRTISLVEYAGKELWLTHMKYKTRNQQPLEEGLRWLTKGIVKVLARIHDKGIVHRDIK